MLFMTIARLIEMRGVPTRRHRASACCGAPRSPCARRTETSTDPRTFDRDPPEHPRARMSFALSPSRTCSTMRSNSLSIMSCSACTSARLMHRPVARHEPRAPIADLEQPRERIDSPAEPAAAEPIEHGVALRRYDVTDSNHVRVWERHIDVAVRVRFEQITVLDAPAPNGRCVVRVERLRGPGGLGQRLLIAVFCGHVVARAEPQARLLVRDDRGARAAQALRSSRPDRDANGC